MAGRVTSLFLVSLMLASLFTSLPSVPMIAQQPSTLDDAEHLFHGFTTGDNWLNLDNQTIAVPNGFNAIDVYDYSDVGVLINNKSEASKTIGWAFVQARNISQERVFIFDLEGTPTAETINRNQFDTYFALPFLEMLNNRSNVSDMNYLVTSKGMPLRVNGGQDKASFDQEFALLGGSYNSTIGGNYWSTHSYGPLSGGEFESFSRQKHGFYLVTRLTGYTVETALNLIEKANNSLGQSGTYVLDLATNRNGSGYKFWNDDLYTANTTLTELYNQTVMFDEETGFVTNVSNVMGYASWGSNDGNWGENWGLNTGFETEDTSWSSGVRYWNATIPTLSSGDSFAWAYQTSVKNAGSASLEASISASCTDESSNGTQGIFAEYFDNEGVSFNTGSMPSLIDRVPEHTRIESSLQYGAMYSAYPGLDDRFKNNWGARFSGLIDIPDSGNWTFYLTSDDGSEMWLEGTSLVTNYGSHGMREMSGTRNITAGLHDFKIEFFQGGGPHGLHLKWEGPNQSKAMVPASAFMVSDGTPPSQSTLIHAWNFDEGIGTESNDSVVNGSNMTLYNMNSTNWRACADGGCLWYDGVDDYVEVDVDDWVGDFTVSQWVWANSTTLPNYASVLAVSDNAGSNTSFQHAVFSGEWRLHNNQTHTFGDVEAQQWMHLVTVFDNGAARQYLDGVHVRTTSFPTGSINNIDLYKLGVNRAGSTYFEGMIDKVMVWESALSDDEITILSRDIYQDCQAYSGSGSSGASLEQYVPIDSELEAHAWIVSLAGKRNGDVYGSYTMVVEGVDDQGNVLSTNTSDSKAFENNWESAVMRFRPHEDVTALRIQVPLSVVATSTSGSVFIDSLSLRAIRPHMSWVNGSIAETAVSTGGRSFTLGTTYGQSLVADLLEDGVSGVKGYVYEPYLTAVGQPSVLFSMYAQGYNFAEANAAANSYISWMGVVVGDPKMAPYVSTLHDVEILDTRILNNFSVGQTGYIEVGLENKGMSAGQGQIDVINLQGSVLMSSANVSVVAGDQPGSRMSLSIPITPTQAGWLDVRVRYAHDNASSFERNTLNNFIIMRIWVNDVPVIESVACDQEEYARGDSFLCTVIASDDDRVDSVEMGWSVLCSNCSAANASWNLGSMGSNDNGTTWEAMITLPINVTTGLLALHVTAEDTLAMQTVLVVENVSSIVDAPASWFGPHMSNADPNWLGVTQLPALTPMGIQRGVQQTLTGCVLDVDHDTATEQPQFLVSRGELGELVYVDMGDANHHCYQASYHVENGSSVNSIDIEMRKGDGSLVAQRSVRIEDKAPQIQLLFENESNASIDRIVDNDDEYLRIVVSDVDDFANSYLADIQIDWPGFGLQVLSAEGMVNDGHVKIALVPPEELLEAGEVSVLVRLQDSRGVAALSTSTIPLVLNAPRIVEMIPCNEAGSIEELMFGHPAVLGAVVESDRPLENIQLSLRQLGWSVNAPIIQQPTWVQSNADCLQQTGENVYWFRLQLDGSFASEQGSIQLLASTIDGYPASMQIPMLFRHAPPVIEGSTPESVEAGSDLSFQLAITDLDGLGDVSCSLDVLDENNTAVWVKDFRPIESQDAEGFNQMRWPVPRNLNESTDFLRIHVGCEDSDGETGSWDSSENITVEPYVCRINCNTTNEQGVTTAAKSSPMPWMMIGAAVIILVLTTAVVTRRRGADEKWASDESLDDLDRLTSDSIAQAEASLLSMATNTPPLPDGWTEEAFVAWLEGDKPEDWTDEQWASIRTEHVTRLESPDNGTDEILF
ncbi:MAG: TIGR03790 family protein [Candidatus Poseidoniaceae archaeon]